MIPLVEAVRVLSGVTQSALAETSGLSQTSISLLEAGRLSFSDASREALAAALGVPSPLLSVPAPAITVPRRLPQSAPAKTVRRIEAELTLAFVHVELLVGRVTHDVPLVNATNIRRAWGVEAGPVNDVIALLESHGIICLRRDLRPLHLSALTATTPDGRALMFFDPSAGTDVTRWAMAVELGHVAGSDEPEEFAGEFLVPRSELRAAGSDTGSLIAEYRVPPPAFARLARRDGLVTAAEYRRLRATTSANSSSLPGPSLLAETVLRRQRDGETIGRIAASAFLTAQQLRTQYLAGSRS